jgi:hypothetical protein
VGHSLKQNTIATKKGANQRAEEAQDAVFILGEEMMPFLP